MKKLILIICAILAIHAVHAQNKAKISGQFRNFTNSRIDFWYSSGGKGKFLHQAPPQSVGVGKDGSFSLTVSDMAEPFEISFYAPGIGSNILFFANGYDLHITADASTIDTFRRTLRITGKGSGINSFWSKLNDYKLKHGDNLNWYKKDEKSYLKHLTDSINTVSALIATIGETDNDSHKEFLKEALLRDLKMRSVRSLYTYSFSNQYSYDQTQNLLKKAGFPDANDYVGTREFQFENFPMPHGGWERAPEEFEKMDSLRLERFGSISMRKNWFYQSHPDHPIIRARVEQSVREDVTYADQIREKEGKRVNAYSAYPFRQFPWGQNLSSLIIDGKNYVELAGEGISEKNAADYRFRIITNGIQMTSWTRPSQFRTTTDSKVRYAYFGKFVYNEGQMITLEVENIKDPSINDRLLMDWRPVKKPVIGFDINYTTAGDKKGQKRLIRRSLQEPMTAYPLVPSFIVASTPDIRFRLADSLQSLSFTVKNEPENYEYDIILRQNTSRDTTVTHMGKTNTRFVIDKFYWDQPGEYEVKFIPRLYKLGYPHNDFAKDFTAQAETIRFTVMPALQPAVFSLRELVWILTAFAVTAGLIFYLFRRRQQQRVVSEQQQKQLATLQLRSVRSQLNPHFMFNALAGIQNLMNKNEPDAANLYLSKFARLTRNVLDDNEKDLVTISSEIALLEDYLEMEKLRFGFNYAIETDKNIDKENTEIPAMLLQPFVENAVKHGVSGLKEKGLVTIRFDMNGKDLIMQVQDNGNGKSASSMGEGKGVKLSGQRIDLYNRLHKETAITLNIKQENGMLVTLKLKDWI